MPVKAWLMTFAKQNQHHVKNRGNIMIKFRALMEAIQNSIQGASQAQEQYELKATLDDYFEVAKEEETDETTINSNGVHYKAKTVSMDFPTQTADGLEIIKTEVPLITLSPISSARISEVKFTTELEVTSDKEGTLLVNFPKKTAGRFSKGQAESRSNTTIEICLTGSENPEGLKHIIEGYEKILRAQIPA
jgi:hypothetical protein